MSKRSAGLATAFSAVGHLYVHLFTAIYAVIFLSLEKSWSIPYHELLKLWTLGALLVGLAALPAGWLGDRWSKTGMMVVYFLGLGASSIVCGLVDGPTALLVGLGAIGLFASIYHPVGIAWLVRNARRRGKALGFNGVFGGAGVASAGLVAGSLIDLWSWRAAFILPGVLCVATGLLLLWFVLRGEVTEGDAAAEAGTPSSPGSMLRGFLILLWTMLVVGLVFQATQAALPKVFDLRLRDLAGDGAFGIGAIVSVVYGVGSLVQILGGHLADRYPLKRVYLGCFLLQVPVLVGVAAFAGLPLIAVATLTVLLSTGALPAENMLLARFTPERHRSLAYGIKFVLAFGSAPLAIWLAAEIQERTGEFLWLFVAMGVLTATAFVAALFLPGDGSAAVARQEQGGEAAPAPQPAE
ncbi:Predicted arabinose efflux permease, MFS family [Tistlia consotensis]|uniref:Predicted arabinose efflux permease, MFS family n=1 Tax=Tistlia consotensis USBA 355 TaxID=560819 RepID=A0A1Y6C3C1_9PROT|nr:MFS transporter [Tistlia consotensis]SMF43525.1 Predicted arabinose efflux permease, MFS family [Tistlia consotensis USBA 355]SNR42655.1 Predicted arabinose efflux permease, MFS family [Tistlia consotensis]